MIFGGYKVNMNNNRFFRFKHISIIIFMITLCLTILLPCSSVFGESAFPGSSPYTVKSGDSLYFIANRNNISLEVLKIVNGLGSDLIIAGQVINLPVNTGCIFTQYTINPGDYLYMISRKFGVSLENLKRQNNISSNMIIAGQVLTIPLTQQRSLADTLSAKNINPANNRIDIVIDKSDHTLMLFADGTWLKTYHVELGSGGLGDKQVTGDRKTPEGPLYICEDSVFSPADQYLGTRWMRLSYPTTQAALRGLNAGIIDWNTYNSIKTAINNGAIPPQNTPLGEGIGIHGGNSPAAGINWTWGCIGLTSSDAEEFFDYTGIGTRVCIER